MHHHSPLRFLFLFIFPAGPPKTEAQLKKEAKKREKLEKFQQKKEMEAKKKTQPLTEVDRIFFVRKVSDWNIVAQMN